MNSATKIEPTYLTTSALLLKAISGVQAFKKKNGKINLCSIQDDGDLIRLGDMGDIHLLLLHRYFIRYGSKGTAHRVARVLSFSPVVGIGTPPPP